MIEATRRTVSFALSLGFGSSSPPEHRDVRHLRIAMFVILAHVTVYATTNLRCPMSLPLDGNPAACRPNGKRR
jgi:hypothetical protein